MTYVSGQIDILELPEGEITPGSKILVAEESFFGSGKFGLAFYPIQLLQKKIKESCNAESK